MTDWLSLILRTVLSPTGPITGTPDFSGRPRTVDDVLQGTASADSLSGDGGHDILKGGLGDDLLDGGKGRDSLYGDEGADTFVLAQGMDQDIIYNFEDGTDSIQLGGGLSFADLTIASRGSSTRIAAYGEVLAILSRIDYQQIGESDFVLR
ncbi:MAG: hypothetical protein GDA38_27380 [Hormoscilla sp. SP12CHS1]|nr:hypothetical protein [Hormoscilla sp. SP12CHS1]